MSLLIFKFCLPILLGYSLFVGLSGRFIPFLKPNELIARPSWFLGLWTGLAVTIVTGVAMHMAFELPLADVKPLVKPTGLILAVALITGLIGYFLYRSDVIAELRYQTALDQSAESLSDATNALNESETSPDDTDLLFADVDLRDEMNMDSTLITDDVDDEVIADHVLARNDLVIDGEIVDSEEQSSVSLLFDQVATPTPEESSVSIEPPATVQADLFEQQTITEQASLADEAEAEAEAIAQSAAELAAEAEAEAEKEARAAATAQAAAAEVAAQAQAAAAETQIALESSQTEMKEISSELAEQISVNTELSTEVEKLKQTLESESQLRSQTESHLRITRKALKNLEGDTRDFETDKADALIIVEEQLDSHVKETAAAQARANREEAKRISAETTIVDMKKDLLQAKRELRRNTEARAKALSTANKSVAFARQSVQARTRAEARIKQLESRLKLSQETVSSLIAALDKEKARTQTDVTEMAKELILQQKRLDEKRTLDEAGRRTQKRLTRRVAKKVS